MMDWLEALRELKSRGQPAVLVTLISARGHSPRSAGAKMLVSANQSFDSIGGGNLEASATDHARMMLTTGSSEPQTVEISLNEHAETRHGRQCCGGVVEVLFEPVAAAPVVGIFGLGHVGHELARVLCGHPVILHLADSRAEYADSQRFTAAAQQRAHLHIHHAPAPETVLNELPAGAHVLIMTHDHAEDLFLCEAALQRDDLGSAGVIGSRAKWTRFRKQLREAGYADDAIDTITSPIGLPEITGKTPEVIALSVAASLVKAFQHTTAPAAEDRP